MNSRIVHVLVCVFFALTVAAWIAVSGVLPMIWPQLAPVAPSPLPGPSAPRVPIVR